MVFVVFVLLMGAFCFIRSADGALQCHECASPELKTRWHLVGYPQKFTDDAFLSGCDQSLAKVAADSKQKRLQSCDTACITVVITALNEKGKPFVPTAGDYRPAYWIVRGCYDKLMGTQIPKADITLLTDTNNVQYKYGNLMVLDASGIPTAVPMEMSACKPISTDATVLYCNYDEAKKNCNPSSPSALCTKDPTTAKCRMTNKDNAPECQTTSFCTKYTSSLNGRETIVRSCSNINPFVPPGTVNPPPKQSACGYYESLDYLPPGGQNQYSFKTCYCNDNDLCNSAIRQSAVSPCLLLAITPLIALIFSVK